MLKRDHCALCDNHQFSIEKGIYCNLTNEPPAFNNKCSSIVFNEDAKKAIEQIDSAYSLLEKQHTLQKASFAAYSVVGFAVLALIYYLTMYLLEIGWVSIITIAGAFFGLAIIAAATQNLGKHKSKYKDALERKENMDAVFDHYNIQYETNVKIEKVHGEYEFDYDITFIGN